jgi:uncharacterized protein YggE
MKSQNTLSILSTVVVFLTGALAMMLLWPQSPVAADSMLQAEALPRTITVVGDGKATTAPDIAVINIGVQVSDPDVKTATSQATGQMEAVIATLKEMGVADEDIQTSYYNLYVDRPYGPQGPVNEAQYQVSNTMQVTIRNPEQITDLLGATIEAGANNINSVEFRLSDPAELRSEARAKAVADAEARATELADLNGLVIGPVVSVSEVIDSGAYFISEQSANAAVGLGGGGAGPISPGDVTVSAQLQIVYGVLQ